jgi:hypothetical protein
VNVRPNPVGLPEFVFSTPAPLVAAWLCYADHLQYMRYDVERNLFLFYDPDGDSKRIIHELSLGDPSVSLKKFEKIHRNLRDEKHRAQLKASAARREVRRGQ